MTTVSLIFFTTEIRDLKQGSHSRCGRFRERANIALYRHSVGPHDGGLENGGVYVNPADTSVIYLLEGGYLCRTPREVEEAKESVAETEFDRYLETKENSFI